MSWGDKLEYADDDDDVLSRPLESPTNFDWNSTYGLYVKGKELAGQREYVDAKSELQSCLEKNPYFLPALVEMASLANRRADYAAAYDFARRALSIDTYDPSANYQFGIASAGLDHNADSKAAFSIATLSTGWRSAACTELAKEYLREKEYDHAMASAKESLDYDRFNLDALELEACIDRLNGDTSRAEAAQKTLLTLDPISHFAEFEKYLMGKANFEDVTGMIRSELSYETYLELACWYHDVGLDKDALKVLDLAPPQTEVMYWQAYLGHDTNLLARANAAPPEFVFPFRRESIAAFEWASKQSGAWQPKYYLALIRWFQGELDQARQLLAGCGDQPRFAPFYAARAQVIETGATRDLQRAAQLDPGQWRYGAMLVRHYLERTNATEAEKAAADYAQRFSQNDTLTVLHAESLVASGNIRPPQIF